METTFGFAKQFTFQSQRYFTLQWAFLSAAFQVLPSDLIVNSILISKLFDLHVKKNVFTTKYIPRLGSLENHL